MDVNTKLKYADRIAKVIVNNQSAPTITIQFQDNQEIKNISRRVASTLEKIITLEEAAIDGLLNLMNFFLKQKSIYEHIHSKELVYLHNIDSDGLVIYYKIERYKIKANGTIYDFSIDEDPSKKLKTPPFGWG